MRTPQGQHPQHPHPCGVGRWPSTAHSPGLHEKSIAQPGSLPAERHKHFSLFLVKWRLCCSSYVQYPGRRGRRGDGAGRVSLGGTALSPHPAAAGTMPEGAQLIISLPLCFIDSKYNFGLIFNSQCRLRSAIRQFCVSHIHGLGSGPAE